jgi:hypothetical protein
VSSKIDVDGYTSEGTLESVVVSDETSLGINIKASELISLNLGLFVHYSLTSYFPDYESNGLMIGFHTSMLFKLSK